MITVTMMEESQLLGNIVILILDINLTRKWGNVDFFFFLNFFFPTHVCSNFEL